MTFFGYIVLQLKNLMFVATCLPLYFQNMNFFPVLNDATKMLRLISFSERHQRHMRNKRNINEINSNVTKRVCETEACRSAAQNLVNVLAKTF